MKILWVDLVSELGGAQRSLLDVAQKLILEPDIELSVAVPHGPLASRLSASGIPVHPVTPVRATRRVGGFFSTVFKLLFASNDFSRVVRSVKPDIIHANALPSFLAVVRPARKIPVFWHVRDLRQPVPLMREASHKATHIIAPSEAVAEYLAETLSRQVYSSICTIPNGIDTETFRPRDSAEARVKFGLPEDVPVIGMVAHFVKWKNHAVFLDMAALLKKTYPAAQFVLVGRDLFHEAGKYIRSLKTQANELGLNDSVRFIENCDDAQEIIPAFTVLVHPAIGEPFGRVVCEAMACEVPVVAIDSAGPQEILNNGKTGILCETDSADKLAEGVSRLLSDEVLRKQFAKTACEAVLARYSINRVANDLAALYRKTLDYISSDRQRGQFTD
ncbi:MAG: glycosyltransferase family 4 protein [Kiritimatiellae bacterium]|nr:glycosyltransferase family 4 protein [Kiritimatiellia bacterium]